MSRNVLTSVFLFCYSLLLFLLLHTGAISQLINPRLTFLTVFSFILLVVMFLFSLRQLTRKSPPKHNHGHEQCSHIHHPNDHDHHDHTCACGCEHHHEKNPVKPSDFILFLPIILLLLIPPQTLTYQESNTDSPYTTSRAPRPTYNDSKQLAPSPSQSGILTCTQLDIGNLLFQTPDAPDKETLLNSRLYLEGTVLTVSSLPAGEIVLYRYVITCCAADGVPLGVIVKLPEGQDDDFEYGDWVGVEGTLELKPFEDHLKPLEPVSFMVPPENIYPYFTATKVYRLGYPDNPYLFP